MVINEFTSMAENGISAFYEDEDLLLTEKSLPANIKLFETLLKNQPDNSNLLTLLAQMYGSYGFAFFEPRLEAAKLGISDQDKNLFYHPDLSEEMLKQLLDGYFLKGAEYALRALEVHHKNCRQQIGNVSSLEAFFKSLTKKDVPALFWYGFNLGEYVNLNRDSVKVLSKAHLAEKAMLRVIELDPEYFYGCAHLVLLVYYGSRPPMMGGNPDYALKHYNELKNLSGNDFLLADLFYARYCLYQKMDKNEFLKTLNYIAQHKAKDNRFILLNQVAVNRAKIYLKTIDRFFDE